MTTEIILVGQTAYNPHLTLARDILKRYHIPYHEINIETLPALNGDGALRPGNIPVPTLFIAQPKQAETASDEALWAAVDAAGMLRRPVNRQLEDWLHEHGFLKRPYRR